ncbi:MAG: TetR/AcrR family transcriptional regulator [Nocardioidaceae bacterium]
MTTYHHGHLREALTSTAFDLARTEGPDGVVLREVARRTGVSHNAAYRHFADRDELLAQVAAMAMTQLARAMQARIDAVTEAPPGLLGWVHLAEVGRAYVEFALAEPGLFGIAFAAHRSADQPAKHGQDVETDPYAVLGRVLDELVLAGQIPPSDRSGADEACWAAVHGFSLLHLAGPLADEPAAARDAALDKLLTTIARGLGAPQGGPATEQSR